MNRRTLLVALVILGCTDQPTEPTTTEAGPAAVDPLPWLGDAQPLHGEIQGANGAPLQVELGHYDYPVLAKITIAGSLGYGGMETGYYPGSGTINYQGRYIPLQNNCAHALYVRIIGSGPVAGGFGGCPSTWQTSAAPIVYAVVGGDLVVTRNAPAPGACYYGGIGPCATISGSQTVEVEPVEGQLKVTVDTTVAAPSGLIVAKFSADPVAAFDKLMPFTLLRVRFEGYGPILGGGTTTGCTTWHRVNECSFRLYQSGYLVAEGVVSGKFRVQKKWLRVIGGQQDEPIILPPDSLPGGGDGDSSATGGGGDGECDNPPSPGSMIRMTCEPPEEDQDTIFLDVVLQRDSIAPVTFTGYFNAITQVATQRGRSVARLDVVGVSVRARRKSGRSMGGALVRLVGTPLSNSGGHNHEILARPLGTFLRQGQDASSPFPDQRGSIQVTLDADGGASLSYRSSGLAGIEVVGGAFAAPQDAPVVIVTDSLTLRVPGLWAMQRDVAPWWVYKDQVPSIPEQRHGNTNHWLMPQFRDSVIVVFADFFRKGGKVGGPEGRFVVTDAGLIWGGLLESTADGEWQAPHLSHRIGNDLDIRSHAPGTGVAVLSAKGYELLEQACRPNVAKHIWRVRRCDQEPPPDGNARHIHIEGL